MVASAKKFLGYLYIGASLAGLFSAVPSIATLGGDASSIDADRAALGAVVKGSTASHGYTVVELESDSHVLREYLSSNGVVFAVSWKGIAHAKLSTVLGTYYNDFKSARQTKTRARGARHMSVTGTKVVVERWGHQRKLQGRAFVPSLLPTGMRADDITN